MHLVFGILGLAVILIIAYAISYNRKAINFRTIIGAFSIQVFFAVFVLYIPIGQKILEGMAYGVSKAISAGQQGVSFVFGPLADGNVGFIFAISVLAIIIFFSSLISVLYYLKIMPLIINTIGLGLHKLLKTSRPESLSATANIFVGQTEAPLIVKPFLPTVTKSELFAIMVGGLSSVAGGALAGYAALGIDIKFLIAAAFMSAPAGLLMAKIIMPETETPIQTLDAIEDDTDKPVNVVEAAADGASAGLHLVLNVGAMLIAFVGLISLMDYILGGITGMFGYHITFATLLGYLFAPVAFIIGLPISEIIPAGTLLGQKVLFNEFVAYLSFSKEVAIFSPRSQAIITFALCGFANLSSIGILIGGLGFLAPNHKKNVAKFALHAVVAGSLANFLSATLAGIILSL